MPGSDSPHSSGVGHRSAQFQQGLTLWTTRGATVVPLMATVIDKCLGDRLFDGPPRRERGDPTSAFTALFDGEDSLNQTRSAREHSLETRDIDEVDAYGDDRLHGNRYSTVTDFARFLG